MGIQELINRLEQAKRVANPDSPVELRLGNDVDWAGYITLEAGRVVIGGENY